MKYDFNQVIDRNNTRSSKYDERIKKFGTNDVIPLWVADMDFKTAQPIIDALKSKAEEGIFGYVSRPDSYFKSIVDWQKRRNGWDIDPSLCSWSLGVVPAMCAMVEIFTGEFDKVIIQTPVYSEFYDIVEGVKNRQVLENKIVEVDGRWKLDLVDFEEKAKEAKMFLLCSPHNPLGIVYTQEQLKQMLDICFKYDVLVISDEIHSDLIFHGKKFIPTAIVSDEAKNKVISCISGTKTFNLAGLQACTVVFPTAEMKVKFDKYWGKMDIHRNNSFSSVAMEAAFNEGEDWLEQLLVYLSDNFDYIKKYCNENIPEIKPNIPDATYLVWLDCRDLGLNNDELKKFMIEKAKIGLNEGWTFSRSLSGFMRLNAACPRSVLEKALVQLDEAVKSLKEERN